MLLAAIKTSLIIQNSRKMIFLVYLFFYFCYKIIESGWAVGWMIIKGSRGENGGLVNYQTTVQKPWHLVLLFNMLSMTPGSLSVDVLDNGKTIKVHLLNINDKEQFIAVTENIERLLMKAL